MIKSTNSGNATGQFKSLNLLEVPEKDTYCEKNIPLCPAHPTVHVMKDLSAIQPLLMVSLFA